MFQISSNGQLDAICEARIIAKLPVTEYFLLNI